MASLLYHKDAQQFYVAPVIGNKQQTIYLGQKKRAAKTACRKILSKIEKINKQNKKKKESSGEKILKMLEAQEERKRANSPAMFFHKHAKQFCVSVSVDGKSRTVYFGRDEQVAAEKYHQFMAQYKRDKQSVVRRHGTFAELVGLYLENIENRVTPSTLCGYKNNLKVFCDFAPEIKIPDITYELLDKFKVSLLSNKIQPVKDKQGVSVSTINHYLTNIKTVMNWGLCYNKIRYDDVKVHKIKKEAVKRPLPRFLSKEEIKKILNYEKYLPKSYNKRAQTTLPGLIEIVKFLLVTGRRIQEVVNMKRKDINLEDRYYVVTRDKTARTNPVTKIFYLNDAAIEIIKPLYEILTNDEYIFSKDGRQLSMRALSQRFKRLLSHLGITGVSFKELRHSFASHMRMAGEPLENVRDYLGHTSVKTTEIYAHVGENHLKKRINNPIINELVKNNTVSIPAKNEGDQGQSPDDFGSHI